MEAHVLVDAAEGAREIVGIAHEEAAGVLREAREPAVRVEAQHVFGALDEFA